MGPFDGATPVVQGVVGRDLTLDEGYQAADAASRAAADAGRLAARAAGRRGLLRRQIPVAVDGVDNRVASAYSGWPDRLYLVGRDGRVAFQGGEGPFGFKPAELEAAIERELSASGC